jgi:hypothetical protein
LGLDKRPQHRVRHKVWEKQLANNTRQLKLGTDRARQRTELEMLVGTEVFSADNGAGAEPVAGGGCGWKQLQDRLQRQVTTQPLMLEARRAQRMHNCGRSGSQGTGLKAREQMEGLMEWQGW